jgi:hypothetical protein
MDRDAAVEVGNSWYEMAEDYEELGKEYHGLVRVLSTVLPADTDPAASALVAGRPGVVALAGDGLYLVTMQSREEGAPQPTVERFPLNTGPIMLRIREDMNGRALAGRDPFGGDSGSVHAHTREWTLTWPGGREVSFQSVVRRSGALHTGPDRADVSAALLIPRDPALFATAVSCRPVLAGRCVWWRVAP